LNLNDYKFVQLFKKRVLESIKVESTSTSFVAPEILIRAKEKGFRIKETFIDYYPRKKGKATSVNSN